MLIYVLVPYLLASFCIFVWLQVLIGGIMTGLLFAIFHHFKFVGDEKTSSFLMLLVIQLLYVASTRLEYESFLRSCGSIYYSFKTFSIFYIRDWFGSPRIPWYVCYSLIIELFAVRIEIWMRIYIVSCLVAVVDH